MKLTYKQIKNSEEINILIEKGNEVLGKLGYTEHSKKPAAKAAETGGDEPQGAAGARSMLWKLVEHCRVHARYWE